MGKNYGGDYTCSNQRGDWTTTFGGNIQNPVKKWFVKIAEKFSKVFQPAAITGETNTGSSHMFIRSGHYLNFFLFPFCKKIIDLPDPSLALGKHYSL